MDDFWMNHAPAHALSPDGWTSLAQSVSETGQWQSGASATGVLKHNTSPVRHHY